MTTTYGGIVSFGEYTFENLDKFDDNFADAQTQFIQLPGMDGGFDAYGDEEAPSPVGRVTMGFTLWVNDRADMDALRDAVKTMKSYGLAKLIKQPTDSADDQRWTWARLKTPKMPEHKGKHTDLWQPVTLTFECPNPVWYVERSTHWSLDGTYTFQDLVDNFFTVGNIDEEHIVIGASNTLTITNNGTAIAIPKVIVYPERGQSCKNIRIQRLSNSAVVEEIKYNGTLEGTHTNGSDILVANGRTHEFTLNAESAFDSLEYTHPQFVRLLPGSNAIRVLLEDSGLSPSGFFYSQSPYKWDWYGTYLGITIANGYATYGGASGWTMYTMADLFDETEFSLITRQRVSSSSDWADSTLRYAHELATASATNRVSMYKDTVSGQFGFLYEAGGTPSTVNKTSVTTTDWFTTGMSVSANGDEMRTIWNGVYHDSATSLGTWDAGTGMQTGYIGSYSKTQDFWNGDISDFIITLNSVVLSDTDHATIHTALDAGTLTPSQLDTICGAGNWEWYAFNESTQAVKVSFSFKDSYR